MMRSCSGDSLGSGAASSSDACAGGVDKGTRKAVREMQQALHQANNASLSLEMSTTGARKRSKCGSQRGGTEEEGKPALTRVEVQPHTPDGRCCKTCPRRDSDEDPVDKALGRVSTDGKALLMVWAYPVKSGRTVGDYCYYCCRVYLREGKPFKMSMTEWKNSIAKAGDKALQGHHKKVKAVVEQIINVHGGKRDAKLNWEEVFNEVLTHFSVKQLKATSNQRRFLTEDEYEEEFGKAFVDGAQKRHERAPTRVRAAFGLSTSLASVCATRT